MIKLGEKIGREILRQNHFPLSIELIGDVGAGKTTLVKGIARGLNITEDITSPSFTISKIYQAPAQAQSQAKNQIKLVHYDFYRLPDPGLMAEDLAENLADKNTLTIIEWADSVADLLPENHQTYRIYYNDDGTRTVTDAPGKPAGETA